MLSQAETSLIRACQDEPSLVMLSQDESSLVMLSQAKSYDTGVLLRITADCQLRRICAQGGNGC